MFKVNNKERFTTFFGFTAADFEQVNVCCLFADV